MRVRNTGFGFTVLLSMTLWAEAARATDHSATDLIKGAISRSEAVFSGRIQYRISSGFRGKEADKAFANDLTFSSSSWRLDVKYPMSDMKVSISPALKDAVQPPAFLTGVLQVETVSHGGKFVEYKAIPQLDATVRHTVRISAEKPLRSTNLQAPPVFAGSFWYECTKQFVQKNTGAATALPPAEVNGILCQVMEWKVSKQYAFDAFHATNGLTARGGLLRLYISPELGYVIPRMECVGDQGKVAATYDASDFKDCGDGKFIPRRCSLQYNDADGPGFYLDYDISEVKRVNERFADKEFILELPVGTIVSDARSGTHSTVLELKDEASIPADLVDVIRLPSWRFWRRTPAWALCLGAAAGAAVLLAGYFGWKKLSSRRQK